jgi:predicted O-methyltransferase YrrM
MNKNFTVDWFSSNISKFDDLLSNFKNSSNLNFLEIGSFEGKSSCYFYENFIQNSHGSTLTCIDTWEGSMENTAEQKNSIWSIFNNNISEYDPNKLIIKRGYSRDKLKELNNNYYDFIYVDGSHTSRDVLEDAVLSFDLLKVNGVMTFDDYLWKLFEDPLLTPKPGIDSFLSIYKNYIKIVEYGYQVSLIKLKD